MSPEGTAPAVAAGGLSEAEAGARLAAYGPNVMPARKRAIAVEYLLHFRNPLVILLVLSSVILGSTGDRVSMWIILVVVGASVTLDFVQEHRAARALAGLQSMIAATAVVVREGRRREIRVADVVPGDRLLLAAGDVVPADGRLLEADHLYANEAALTGEPYPIEKRAGPGAPVDAATLRMGTAITGGTATLHVTATGGATALGAIAGELVNKEADHPLERGTRRFGMMILRFTLFLVLFVLLVNAGFHRPWLESFVFAVALAVGLTPELLPMIVSVTLARGALRLAARHVIVKRPSAVYALGGIDVLCTDKTGTLTEAAIHVDGSQNPQGEPDPRVLTLAARNSRCASGVRSPLDDAVLACARDDEPSGRKLDERAFDFERRFVSVLVALDDGPPMLIVKGAPEEVLGRCVQSALPVGATRGIDATERQALLARFARLGNEGLRVLAVATRKMPAGQERIDAADEYALTFEGFVTFVDPARKDAAAALAALARAHIDVRIVTGDGEAVARHVCAALGLPVRAALPGHDIERLTDEALAAAAADTTLFCRVSPAQKTRVIRALQSRGHVVGFMGDGINDAPALRAADVGISVRGAVGVAREAADVILTRGRLNVVHDGVLEGRRTYANIMKYLMMATSSNFGNMLSMALGTLFLPFLPMLPVQILLNNLLYDVSETAIPFDRVDAAELRKPHVLDMHEIRRFMLVLGPVSSLFDLATFALLIFVLDAGASLFQTGWFIESIATQVLVIFVIRTRGNPLRSHPHPFLAAMSVGVAAVAMILPFSPLGRALGFVEPPPAFYAMLAVTIAIYLALAEVAKRYVHRAHSRLRHGPRVAPVRRARAT